MAKTGLLLTAIVLSLSLAQAMTDMCPSGGIHAVSGQLTINSQGDIPLAYGTDIQCYNYSLPYVFECPPSVAIGIYGLIQPQAHFKVPRLITYFSQSKQSTLIAMESFPSLSEHNGDTHDGAKSPSTSLQKPQRKSLQGTIKLTLQLSLLAFLVNKSLLSSQQTAKAQIGKLSHSSMDSKSALSDPKTLIIHPSKFKS